MIVYHGSTEIVKRPDVKHSYRALDFGMGFYVTTVREQAERWARRKASILGKDSAIVNFYQMDDNTDGLLVKSFDEELTDCCVLNPLRLADKIHRGVEGIQYLDFKVLVQILGETEQELFV